MKVYLLSKAWGPELEVVGIFASPAPARAFAEKEATLKQRQKALKWDEDDERRAQGAGASWSADDATGSWWVEEFEVES